MPREVGGHRFHAWISEADHAWLEAEAKRIGSSLSYVLRTLIREQRQKERAKDD